MTEYETFILKSTCCNSDVIAVGIYIDKSILYKCLMCNNTTHQPNKTLKKLLSTQDLVQESNPTE